MFNKVEDDFIKEEILNIVVTPCNLQLHDFQGQRPETCRWKHIWTSVVATTPKTRKRKINLATLSTFECDDSTFHVRNLKLPLRSGKAALTNSILTPFKASAAGGISSMCRITG